MSAFDTLKIAGSSLGMHQTWLDTLASNIANLNTVTSTDEDAFQAQMVIAAADPQGGVEVAGVAVSDPEGVLKHDPGNPLADEDGYVRAPAVDMASQMSQLIQAQRGYQASVQTTKYAQDAYTSALQIGAR
ncbi:flagellar basal body rod protein FlgC [Nocardioides pantholopis]|uniref:flagellar basal body rod protein FlgC n=1 Tax=Nocardioides pantholopis TaxID=2483798 RepID=UPI000F082D66|nr:flagellar basal body rod C-terminal domain-containing protein [Nocardioides pantholopis]